MKMLTKFALLLLALLWQPQFLFAGELPKSTVASDYRKSSDAQIKLGQLLFYDRVLSGTYRVSCATCHNHDRASSNGFALPTADTKPIDELAVNNLPVYDAFSPSARHAPALFNVGAKEFAVLFSDGRISQDNAGNFIAPTDANLPPGLRDVLAVQALFPAISKDELVGNVDNDVKAAAHQGNQAVWNVLTKRVQDLPDYLPYFSRAFPDIQQSDTIEISHIANAISAFVAAEWRADDAPFDTYLRGENSALSEAQLRGADLFYGKAKCDVCHGGIFQTDHAFHNIAMPVWRFDATPVSSLVTGKEGREGVSGRKRDRYKRRTPSLRNVANSAPYGTFGSFETLEAVVRHHLDPVNSLEKYLKHRVVEVGETKAVQALLSQMLSGNDLPEVNLSDSEFSDLIAFLDSLTDENALHGRLGKPDEVPSALALD